MTANTYLSQLKAERRAQTGILAFTQSSQMIRDGYFKKLRQFSSTAMAGTDDNRNTKNPSTNAPEVSEYPPHVAASLYSVLSAYSQCICLPGHTGLCHPTRLRLQEEFMNVDGYVGFDMLFAASPTVCDYWQDIQVRVAM